ncbi:tripartite tricarboxylate transporter substrate binding protein [Cupriavidus metallidurans]|uniref:Bug family tripartite tricarboxylate transporter substrate binding protein n=1 Tax=Cupriavidus TaxID=106589 RepID=UPI000E8E4121|nr:MULTISPECIES: tripartite tricarboxylate transporter substrate binding protein [unclassified Cupriavidus]GMG94300.1 ABC transporter substrate-binding protein [Cupriavidus sp. TKC]HBD39712.1 ABC transporter substrate-binding protein [Cupriavidus sp.]HBO81527.1 ABC transporter substrate-binding protein [Cupriavidus sp.]
MKLTSATRRWAMLCALVVTIGGALTPMDARSEYPDKPIKLVVSFPPGSGTDSNARYLARKMEERLGKPVVVENRPGGNSFIAAQTVTRAEPDGYTLLLASNSPVATNVAMFRKLPYDPVSELAPIARLGVGAMALVVSASSRYQTVDALLSAAREHPGTLNYGAGSASYQIATELFLAMGHIKANHVPYKGAAPALTDLAAGQVDFVFADYGAVLPLLNGGKLRLLAVTSDKRLGSQPNTPTLQESGFPGYFMVNWTAAFAPANTPKPIIAKLEKLMVDIYRTPETSEFLSRTSWDVFVGDAKALRTFQLAEIKKWSDAAERAGVPKQ